MARKETFLTLLYGLVLGLLAAGLILVVARRPAGQPIVLREPPTPRPLRVHVLGGVATPGVYGLPVGSIWQDAINAAGGPLPDANLNGLNLAQPVSDGDQIVVPLLTPTPRPTLTPTRTSTPRPTATLKPGEPSPTPPPTTQATQASAATNGPTSTGAKININTASSEELQTLPRIGPAIAQRIIDYRAVTPFKAIEDIMNVKGIGPATFAQIKDLITVGP